MRLDAGRVPRTWAFLSGCGGHQWPGRSARSASPAKFETFAIVNSQPKNPNNEFGWSARRAASKRLPVGDFQRIDRQSAGVGATQVFRFGLTRQDNARIDQLSWVRRAFEFRRRRDHRPAGPIRRKNYASPKWATQKKPFTAAGIFSTDPKTLVRIAGGQH